jgi:uncharacterized membrane protein YhaH (DUF805 family)
MQYFLTVLKKYAIFSGRARRAEYWYFTLFSSIISVAFSIVGVITEAPLLSSVYSLAVMLPSLAVGVRRLHDVGKSGWFLLIPIYNLVLLVTPGIIGNNEYGADPKAAYNDFLNPSQEVY